jgi:hypothetical protein
MCFWNTCLIQCQVLRDPLHHMLVINKTSSKEILMKVIFRVV